MTDSFRWAQVLFALLVALVVGERVYFLHYRAATSDAAFRWIVRALERGAEEPLRQFALARPSTQLGRLLSAMLSDHTGVAAREQLFDLRDEALVRLRLLRVCATIASTLGLLAGILALARANSDSRELLALQAGAAQRHALSEAIASMAIGVATSAFCFQALASLRTAAERMLLQARQVARAAEVPLLS